MILIFFAILITQGTPTTTPTIDNVYLADILTNIKIQPTVANVDGVEHLIRELSRQFPVGNDSMHMCFAVDSEPRKNWGIVYDYQHPSQWIPVDLGTRVENAHRHGATQSHLGVTNCQTRPGARQLKILITSIDPNPNSTTTIDFKPMIQKHLDSGDLDVVSIVNDFSINDKQTKAMVGSIVRSPDQWRAEDEAAYQTVLPNLVHSIWRQTEEILRDPTATRPPINGRQGQQHKSSIPVWGWVLIAIAILLVIGSCAYYCGICWLVLFALPVIVDRKVYHRQPNRVDEKTDPKLPQMPEHKSSPPKIVDSRSPMANQPKISEKPATIDMIAQESTKTTEESPGQPEWSPWTGGGGGPCFCDCQNCKQCQGAKKGSDENGQTSKSSNRIVVTETGLHWPMDADDEE